MKSKEPSGGKGFGHLPPHRDRKIFGDLAVTFLKEDLARRQKMPRRGRLPEPSRAGTMI